MKKTFAALLSFVGTLTLSTLGVIGCGGDEDSGPVGPSGSVEILNWWYTGGERQALNALLDVYKKKHPEVNVVNSAAIGAVKATEQLNQRMAQGNPPDIFQVINGIRMLDWVEFNGNKTDNKLEPLDALADASGFRSLVPQRIIDSVTYDGHIYAVPVNIHRGNCLFYNKKIFAEQKLLPPTTLDELYAVADALHAAGVTPFAFASKDPWTTALAFWENILVASAGPVYYMDFFLGKKHPEDPEIRTALEAAAKIFSYANPDADELLYGQAVKLVADGKAAMHFNGDWAKGEFLYNKQTVDIDFGQVTVGKGVFVYVIDSFVLPQGAPNREAAVALLETMGSIEGQDALNPLKGSVPSRSDGDKSLYDAQSQRAMEDLKTATLIPARSIIVPTEFFDPVDQALGEFLGDKDVDKMILALQMYYDILQTYNASQ